MKAKGHGLRYRPDRYPYRRFETGPKTVAQPVEFCLMDVSGSDVRAMKDLAKRLHLCLGVPDPEISHVESSSPAHDRAEEVDRGYVLPGPPSRRHLSVERLQAMNDISARGSVRFRLE